MATDDSPTPEEIRQALNAKELRRAASAIGTLLASRPEDPVGWQLLAQLATLRGEAQQEIHALRQWLARQPNQPSGWLRLASVLAAEGQLQEALESLREAVPQCPADTRLLLARGRIALSLMSIDEALTSAQDLGAQPGGAASASELLGDCKRAQGDVAAALQAYRRALELDGERTSALFALVELDSTGNETAFAHARITALEDRNLPPARARHLQFTLALLQERRGDWGSAAGHLHRANMLALAEQRERPLYRQSAMERRIAGLQEAFPAATLAESLKPLPIGATPIFIVGLPRSGTTLLERILASHSSVISAGEPEFAQRAWLDFQYHRQTTGRDGPVDTGHPVDAEGLEVAREQYLEGLLERAGSASWIIDKMPGNFLYAGFLRLLFPDAPILNMLRDPRATSLSLYRANLTEHATYQHALTDLCHYHQQYRDLMNHWRLHLPDPFLEVRYERLVTEPGPMIKALLAALKLPFEATCLQFHEQTATILTASHQQARQPVYTASIDAWKRYGEELGPALHLHPEPESPRELRPGHS